MPSTALACCQPRFAKDFRTVQTCTSRRCNRQVQDAAHEHRFADDVLPLELPNSVQQRRLGDLNTRRPHLAGKLQQQPEGYSRFHLAACLATSLCDQACRHTFVCLRAGCQEAGILTSVRLLHDTSRTYAVKHRLNETYLIHRACSKCFRTSYFSHTERHSDKNTSTYMT